MARAPLLTHALRSLLIAVVLAVPLLTGQVTTTAAAVSSKACRVQNRDTGRAFTALQAAVDAADPGARLTIQGTCVGVTAIDKKVFLKGAEQAGSGRPVLDGDGKGPVLRIKPAARVTIRRLVVQGGSLPTRYTSDGRIVQGRGAGILNRGTLRLWGVVVRGNAAWEGAGIYNAGVLRLRGASKVRLNRAASGCATCKIGGIAGLYNVGTATLRDASSIRDNSGAGAANHGRLTLDGASSIQGNHSGVANYGTLTMNDSTTIRGNLGAYDYALGVANSGGDITMNDASAIAGHHGSNTWGLIMTDGGTLTMSGSSVIRDNRADHDLFGGGLQAGPDITLIGVTCGPGGNVTDNYPHDCAVE